MLTMGGFSSEGPVTGAGSEDVLTAADPSPRMELSGTILAGDDYEPVEGRVVVEDGEYRAREFHAWGWVGRCQNILAPGRQCLVKRE